MQINLNCIRHTDKLGIGTHDLFSQFTPPQYITNKEFNKACNYIRITYHMMGRAERCVEICDPATFRRLGSRNQQQSFARARCLLSRARTIHARFVSIEACTLRRRLSGQHSRRSASPRIPGATGSCRYWPGAISQTHSLSLLLLLRPCAYAQLTDTTHLLACEPNSSSLFFINSK